MADQEDQVLVKAVADLTTSMPGIGLLNNKKRVRAFLTTCKKATELASDWSDTDLESDAWAIDLLKFLWQANNDFRKATKTVILNLERIETESLGAVGIGFANHMCGQYGIRAYFRYMVPDDLKEPAWG